MPEVSGSPGFPVQKHAMVSELSASTALRPQQLTQSLGFPSVAVSLKSLKMPFPGLEKWLRG